MSSLLELDISDPFMSYDISHSRDSVKRKKPRSIFLSFEDIFSSLAVESVVPRRGSFRENVRNNP